MVSIASPLILNYRIIFNIHDYRYNKDTQGNTKEDERNFFLDGIVGKIL